MARNGSGVFQLPASYNPVVAGTTIDPVAFNATMNDLASALTGSLPTDGQTGMTGPFRLAAGTAANPAFGFNPEPSTGLFWPGAAVFGFAVTGGEKMRLLGNGNLIIGTTSDAGQKLQVNGSALISSNTTLGGTLGVAGVSTFDTSATNPTVSVVIKNTGASGAQLQLQGNGATTPNKTIRAYGGNLEIVNSANSAILVSVTDGGAVGATSFSGNHTGGSVSATTGTFSSTVVASGAITGTKIISSFNGVTPGIGTTGDIISRRSATTGVLYFGDSGSAYLTYDGTNYTFGSPGAVIAPSFSGPGTGLTGTAGSLSIGGNAGTVGGMGVSTSPGVGSRIVASDPSGYIYNTYFCSTDNSAASSVTAVMVKAGGDNFLRSGTAQAVATFLNGASMNIAGNSATTSQTTIGRMIGAGPSYGSYGSISMTGAMGGYAGVAFNDVSATFMVNSTQSGVYRTNTAWDWCFTNGVLTVGTVQGANVSGTVASANTANTATTANSATTATAATTANSVMHLASRTDALAYNVAWVSGNPSQLYSCDAVKILSSAGQLQASSLYATGDITAYSDVRVKTDIKTITEALAKVNTLRGVSYTRTDDPHKGLRQIGVIAQEVQKVIPEVVKEDAEGMLSVNYGNMVSVLIEAIKELSAKVDRLEAATL